MKETQPCVLEGPCPGFRCVNKAVTSRQRDVDFIRAVRYVSWGPGGSSRWHAGLGEGLGDEQGYSRHRERHQPAERGEWVTQGSVRIPWGGQIASRNEGEEAGRNWVVPGWLIRLPEGTGPDFMGGRWLRQCGACCKQICVQ